MKQSLEDHNIILLMSLRYMHNIIKINQNFLLEEHQIKLVESSKICYLD